MHTWSSWWQFVSIVDNASKFTAHGGSCKWRSCTLMAWLLPSSSDNCGLSSASFADAWPGPLRLFVFTIKHQLIIEQGSAQFIQLLNWYWYFGLR